jgi:hypothetical protein
MAERDQRPLKHRDATVLGISDQDHSAMLT